METLAAQNTSYKVLLVAKRTAEVAHLLENEQRIIKRTMYWVTVVAAFVVLFLISFHH